MNHRGESHTNNRLASLDQALLFLSTFASFLFVTGLSFVVKPSLAEFVIIVPFLGMAVGLPLYVGYMRGVVELDSMGERARGWAYLIFGSAMYVIAFGESQAVAEFDIATRGGLGYLTIGVMVVLLVFTQRFLRWMYTCAGIRAVPLEDKVGVTAAVTGIFFSSLFYELTVQTAFGTPIYNPPLVYDQITGAIVSASYALVYLFPLIALEFGAHHYLKEGVAEFEVIRKKAFKPSAKPSPRTVHFVNLFLLTSSLFGPMIRRAGPVKVVIGLTSALVIVAGSVLAASSSLVGVGVMFLGVIGLYTVLYLFMKQTIDEPNLVVVAPNEDAQSLQAS